MKLKIECNWCGKEIYKYPSQVKKHNFCSRECFKKYRDEHSTGKVSVVCSYCGKEFMRYKSATKNTAYHFCCLQCMYDFGDRTKNPVGYMKLGRNNIDARRKIGEANRKRTLSEETRKKISEKHRGKKLSKETIEKISKTLTGRTVSEMTRRKSSVAKRNDGVNEYDEDFQYKCPYRRQGGRLAHRVAAEKVLGRKLDRKEVVHHIDLNPANNSPKNLRIFSSNSEHIKFHKELNAVLEMIWG